MNVSNRTTIKKCVGKMENIRFIKNEMSSNPGHTMSSLAKLLCVKLSLISPNGKFQHGGCLMALKSLAARGKIVLPKTRKAGRKKFTPKMVRLGETLPQPGKIPDSVEKMGDGIEIILIGENDVLSKKEWNELMAAEHPLGETRPCGYQVKYLVTYEERYIGAIGFSSSALRLEARDKWIGWGETDREQYQSRVLNMSRFLIRNGVRCANLASYLLSKVLKRFKRDFTDRYGISPWLVETFVDTEKYSGICYKAANWEYLGQTKGRGRNDRYSKNKKSIKDIYVYTLEPEFRSLAGLPEPPCRYAAMDIETGLGTSEWAGQEFGGIDLGDRRLSERLEKIARDKGGSPSASYPQAVNGDRQAMKGYYCFLSNGNAEITFDQVLSRHSESTIRRINAYKTVIAVQDTTDLNYSGLAKTGGLGKISKNGKSGGGSSGLMLHSVFMVTESGLPLGIPYAECSAPSIVNRNGGDRNRTPIEDKESYRWISHYRKTLEVSKKCSDTRIISVMDREADIFELFEEARGNRKTAPVVIRAQHDRSLENMNLKLFEFMRKSSTAFTSKINVPPQRGREKKGGEPGRPYLPARTAEMKVSYEKVTISPPKTPLLKDHAPLTMHAVYAGEMNPPAGAEAIKWFLLTTLEIDSPEDALQCIGFYRCRWRIEEFHRVLKSGCKVEEHKQDSAEKLKRVIAVDMVVAWRIMLLSLLGRECPEMPADIVFNKHELFVMDLLAEKKNCRKRKRSGTR
jgi:hypothetical protein